MGITATNGNPQAEQASRDAAEFFKAAGKVRHNQSSDEFIMAGKHKARIVRIRLQEHQASGAPQVIIEVEVVGGTSAGRRGTRFAVIDNSKPRNLEMLYWDLRACGCNIGHTTRVNGDMVIGWLPWFRSLSNIMPFNIEGVNGTEVNIVAKTNRDSAAQKRWGCNIFINNPERWIKG